MKPRELAKCHQTLTFRVRSGHETRVNGNDLHVLELYFSMQYDLKNVLFTVIKNGYTIWCC